MATPRMPTTRSFWWGKHGYVQKYPVNHRYPSLYKAQQFLASRQSSGTKAPSFFQMKKDPIYHYRATQGWRLLSSWGKTDRSTPTPNRQSTFERDEFAEESGRTQSKHIREENGRLARYERLRKRAEENPFEMLFGGKAARGAWHPWDLVFKHSYRSPEDFDASRAAEDQSTSASSGTSSGGATAGDKTSKATSQSANDSSTEEYVYDPISMRRIPKPIQRKANSPSDQPLSQKMSSVQDQAKMGKSVPGITKEPSSVTAEPARKVERSLERHPREVSNPEKPSGETDVKQPWTARKTENSEEVESLRANDIRAAFNKLKEDFSRREKTLQEQTNNRRQSMQEAFEKRMEEIEQQFSKETTADVERLDSQRQTSDTQTKPSDSERQPSSVLTPGTQKEIEDQVRETEMRHARQEQEKMNILATQMHKRQEADAKLASEIKDQKAAMESHETWRSQPSASDQASSSVWLGEGDMSAQVLKYVANERWYKKRAPHALAREREVLAKREEQKAKDRKLVHEIREIYESSYGTIDTKHKQGPMLESQGDHTKSENVSQLPPGDDSHPQLPSSAVSAETVNECEESPPQSIKTHANEDEANAELPSAASTFLPCNTTIRSWQDIVTGHRLHSVIKTGQEILRMMQEVCHMAIIPRSHRSRVSQLTATYADANVKTRNAILALDLSNIKLKCLITQHQMVHSQSSREKSFAERKDLENVLRPLRETLSKAQELLKAQETASKPGEKAGQNLPKSEKQIYKILALNFDSHEVTSATTTSSLYESSTPPKSAASILSHLSYPASFIPHIEALQDSNFELVAGGRNILVYKRISSEPINETFNESSTPIVQDVAKNVRCSQRQGKEAEPSKDTPASEGTPAQADKAAPRDSSPSSGSSIRITVNSADGATVKIPFLSVSSSENVSKASSAAADCQDGERASTPTTAQSPDQAKTEVQQPAQAGQSLVTPESKDESDPKTWANGRYSRDACASPRRKRSRFWKRLKSFAVRSFLLGGLCYVAGCFSVWYQKRKEALEKAERESARSLAPKSRW